MSGGATCGLPFPVVWQQTRLSEGGGREDEGKGGREGQGRQEALQTQLIHTHHTNSHTHVHTGKTFAQTPTLICLIIITMMSSRCRQTSERERQRGREGKRSEGEEGKKLPALFLPSSSFLFSSPSPFDQLAQPLHDLREGGEQC